MAKKSEKEEKEKDERQIGLWDDISEKDLENAQNQEMEKDKNQKLSSRSQLDPKKPHPKFGSLMLRFNKLFRKMATKSKAEQKATIVKLYRTITDLTLGDPEIQQLAHCMRHDDEVPQFVAEQIAASQHVQMCPICKGPFVSPIVLPDQCAYCRPCIIPWVENIMKRGVHPDYFHLQCPNVCCSKYTVGDLEAVWEMNVCELLDHHMAMIIPSWIKEQSHLSERLRKEEECEKMADDVKLKHIIADEKLEDYHRRVAADNRLVQDGNNNLKARYTQYLRDCIHLKSKGTAAEHANAKLIRNKSRDEAATEKLRLNNEMLVRRAKFGYPSDLPKRGKHDDDIDCDPDDGHLTMPHLSPKPMSLHANVTPGMTSVSAVSNTKQLDVLSTTQLKAEMSVDDLSHGIALNMNARENSESPVFICQTQPIRNVQTPAQNRINLDDDLPPSHDGTKFVVQMNDEPPRNRDVVMSMPSHPPQQDHDHNFSSNRKSWQYSRYRRYR